MKTKLFTICLVLFAFVGTVNAHVWTVSNNAITAGHFTSIQTAADSSNVGDTIYVMGSPTDYGNVTIKTRVTMIGAGYAVTGTQNNWASIVDNIYLDTVSGGNVISGTRIMGMDIGTYFQQTGSGAINSIDIERCYVGYYLYVFGSNWTIRNCDLDNINIQNWGNVFIQNNFIEDIYNSNQTTVNFDHNDFATYSSNAFGTISNALITNNIFYFCTPNASCTSCTFSNNLTTAGATINLNTYAGNTGSGNVFAFAASTGWTDGTIPASTVSENTIWNYKWTLKSTSPGHAAATDGTDIGVYGGSYPMPNLTGATRIPQMVLMNISGVAPVGGNLNVNFISKVQH